MTNFAQMPNFDEPLTFLANIISDRHAINRLTPEQYRPLYQAILANFTLTTPPNTASKTWYLIGTDGCHLCQHAQDIIKQAFAITPNAPTLIVLDLADGSETLLDILGWHIPIILTPTRLLCYPFGVMDIVALFSE